MGEDIFLEMKNQKITYCSMDVYVSHFPNHILHILEMKLGNQSMTYCSMEYILISNMKSLFFTVVLFYVICFHTFSYVKIVLCKLFCFSK